jgi:hypothetical protein
MQPSEKMDFLRRNFLRGSISIIGLTFGEACLFA